MGSFSSNARSSTAQLLPIAERRRRLVEDYSGLVQMVADAVARRIRHAGNVVEVDDLFSIGVIGLFDADARFDASKGHTFETFAEFRVRGAMLDELRKRDFMPRRLRTKSNKLNRVKKKLRAELGRAPESEEVAKRLGLTTAEYTRLAAEVQSYRFVPVEDLFGLSCDQPSPEERVARNERLELFADLLKRLTERQQLVLDLYFTQDLKLREIGDVLGVSEGRVSQIKTAAIETLEELAHDATTIEMAA